MLAGSDQTGTVSVTQLQAAWSGQAVHSCVDCDDASKGKGELLGVTSPKSRIVKFLLFWSAI